jgi:DNA invertase Pin-like site-specific DNA recombinase
MLGAIAQFERELIRERMLVGVAKAKAEGKYRAAELLQHGRKPTRSSSSALLVSAHLRSLVSSASAARRCSGY